MSMIEVDFDAAVEPKPASAGRYRLQITGCEVTKTGPNSRVPGSPQFRVSIGFPDDPNVPNITQFISLPNEQDEPGSANFKVLLLKRFLTHFKIPFDKHGIDTEKMAMEMVGADADTEVTLTEPNENGDVYNRIVVPRIRDEENASGRRR